MGNSGSRLTVLYREHVFRLSGIIDGDIELFRGSDLLQLMKKYKDSDIDDGSFDPFFMEFVATGLNLDFEMFNSVVNNIELRIIAGINEKNFVRLLKFISLKIYLLADSLEGASVELLSYRISKLLVCIRILTKLLPLYYELGLDCKGGVDFFWSQDAAILFETGFDIPVEQRQIVPLGFKLAKACVKLLFIESFTLPSNGKIGHNNYLLWENGISTSEKNYGRNYIKMDSNRLELINLLLSLCSTDLYNTRGSSERLKRNKFLYVFSNCIQEYPMICLVTSIINAVCKHCNNYELEVSPKFMYSSSVNVTSNSNNATSLSSSNSNEKNSSNELQSKLRCNYVMSCLQFLNLISMNKYDSGDLKYFSEYFNINEKNDWLPLVESNFTMNYISTFNKEFDMKLILTAFAKVFKYPVEIAIEQENSPFSSFQAPTSRRSNHVNNTKDENKKLQNNNQQNYNNNSSNGSSNNNSSSSYQNFKNGMYNSSLSTNNENGKTNNNDNDNNSNGVFLPQIPPVLIQMLILFRNLITCNRNFENYVADKFGSKFIIFSIYYLNFYSSNKVAAFDLVPLCSCISIYLTSRKLVLSKMLETFTTNYYTNKLPNFFKLSVTNITNLTYRDFSLIQISNLIINDIKENLKPRLSLFQLLYNLLQIPGNIRDTELIQLSGVKKTDNSALNIGLSYNSSKAILHLLSKMSNKQYLATYASTSNSNSSRNSYEYHPGYKLNLLALFLKAISNYVTLNYNEALNLNFALCRHQKVLIQISESIQWISHLLGSKIPYDAAQKINKEAYLNYKTNSLLMKNQSRLNDLMTNNYKKTNDNGNNNINGNVSNNENNNNNNNNNNNIDGNILNGYNAPIARRWATESINTNSNSIEVMNQLIILDRNLTETKDLEEPDGNKEVLKLFQSGAKKLLENNKADDPKSTRTSADLTNGSELTKIASNGSAITTLNKNLEVYESPDYLQNSNLINDEAIAAMQPEWPTGLSRVSSSKKSINLDYSKTWPGAESLTLLQNISGLLLDAFPAIRTIGIADYYALLKEMKGYKENYFNQLQPLLSVEMKERKEYVPIQFNLSNSNKLLNEWIQTICWVNIFDSHTGYYYVADSLTKGCQASSTIATLESMTAGYSKESTPDPVVMSPLDKRPSNGVSLSRTSSNSSSISGYLSNQGYDNSYQTPLDFADYVASPASNKYRHTRINSGGNGSFFNKFSWTGFQKNDSDRNSILEEDSENGKSNERANGNATFIIDTGLLKPNIWAGTKVKLFNVTRDEKKEFSLLDMTSSFLKRFKFNNNTPANSSETLHSLNTGVHNLNNLSSSSLNSNSGRHQTPRSPYAPGFTHFGTPKAV